MYDIVWIIAHAIFITFFNLFSRAVYAPDSLQFACRMLTEILFTTGDAIRSQYLDQPVIKQLFLLQKQTLTKMNRKQVRGNDESLKKFQRLPVATLCQSHVFQLVCIKPFFCQFKVLTLLQIGRIVHWKSEVILVGKILEKPLAKV